MIGALGGFVDKLHRAEIGPLSLSSVPLAEGEVREVQQSELALLAARLPEQRDAEVRAQERHAASATRGGGRRTAAKGRRRRWRAPRSPSGQEERDASLDRPAVVGVTAAMRQGLEGQGGGEGEGLADGGCAGEGGRGGEGGAGGEGAGGSAEEEGTGGGDQKAWEGAAGQVPVRKGGRRGGQGEGAATAAASLADRGTAPLGSWRPPGPPTAASPAGPSARASLTHSGMAHPPGTGAHPGHSRQRPGPTGLCHCRCHDAPRLKPRALQTAAPGRPATAGQSSASIQAAQGCVVG